MGTSSQNQRTQGMHTSTCREDRINLRYVTDNENLLLANGNMIVVGSNMLWNAVFHTLNVKTFFVVP
uniref:Uncharacterized protein n=1 Tax=Heterorhabditis bacteriophora TaxID=37862 RepID=A0A1I7X764_HETBA